MKTNVLKPFRGSTGTYTGDDSENRAIPHTLGRLPNVVIITAVGATSMFHALGADPTTLRKDNAAAYIVTQMTGTYFYVGDAASYANSANAAGVSYAWTAI